MPARTHGMTKTKTYFAWQDMKKRCTDPSHKSYSSYGGRGIDIDPEWLSFTSFFADMGVCPEGLSLDRKDNNKGYSLGNCRWASASEQQKNTRRSRLITYADETLNICDWEKRLGLSVGTLWHRVERGLTTEQAISAGRRQT